MLVFESFQTLTPREGPGGCVLAFIGLSPHFLQPGSAEETAMARGVNSRRGNRNDNSSSKKAGLLAAAVTGVFAAGAFYARPAQAGSFTWDTTKSGNWSDATNWGGTAPTGADNTD